jgi:hypothetical protein
LPLEPRSTYMASPFIGEVAMVAMVRISIVSRKRLAENSLSSS